ncbi:helix-turn-helix domain-containing GNAT family N-acetyltransferase [Tomitella biformata]|uniref:helix-turn-helix domain-containing GNAT family N-acetyltransferase n=1 Tax=Tomitella biformata TaxID=630403 RepID=UPI000464F150|nr:metalloregulator ArsR/SmtB family transcription factor [Tomitella biformata]
MTSTDVTRVIADPLQASEIGEGTGSLEVADAALYAGWFACLGEPTRVRLLHQVAGAPAGVTIGELAEALGIGQPTVSHHVRKLADAGFVTMHKEGTSTIVSVNSACCVGLPQAADAVMGLLAQRPCCPEDLPADVTVRPMSDGDWDAVLRIYGDEIATRTGESEPCAPTRDELDREWLPGHRWVAEVDGTVVGWAALSSASRRDHAHGVAEAEICVAQGMRERGVGKSLLRAQVIAADEDGVWTLQTSIFPSDRAAIALHHSSGFRTVGVRERIVQVDGQWRDTVLLERRAAV